MGNEECRMMNDESRFREVEAPVSARASSDSSDSSNSSFVIRHSSFLPSEGAATAEAPAATSLAVLLTRHVLRDGELVILLLKPSIWFIPLSSMRFAAAVLILLFAAIRFDDYVSHNHFVWIEAAVFLIAGRLM